MKTLHENNPDNESNDSDKKQTGLSYNRHYSLGTKEIKAYTELGVILRRIHKRIVEEENRDNNGNTN